MCVIYHVWLGNVKSTANTGTSAACGATAELRVGQRWRRCRKSIPIPQACADPRSVLSRLVHSDSETQVCGDSRSMTEGAASSCKERLVVRARY